MAFWDRWFGKQEMQAEPTGQTDAAAQATHESLDRHWQQVGQLEDDVLSYLISPGLNGGPDWPTTRQAYRVVRRAQSIVLASDGLSDPFDGAPEQGNGFGLELFIETPDIAAEFAGQVGEVDGFKHSWAFELLEHVAQTVAGAGGINAQLDALGALSMELPGVSQSRAIAAQVPAAFITADDCIGVLIGGPLPDFSTQVAGMPLSPVRLVPLVLLTAEELQRIREQGGAARQALVGQLSAVTSLQRASVPG